MPGCDGDRESEVGGGSDPPAGLARVGLAGQVQPPRGQQQRHVVTPHSEGAPGLGGAPECYLLCACGCPPPRAQVTHLRMRSLVSLMGLT